MRARVVAVVQARMGSHRLPGKSMMDVCGLPLISHVLTRACLVRGVDEVVMATSLDERDEVIAALARRLGLRAYHGPERDVLGRIVLVAREAKADTVMRITGDCPLLAPDVASEVLGRYLALRQGSYVSYASNDTTCTGYPDGMDVEVFSRDVLELAAIKARSPGEVEHVTPWIRRNCPQGYLHLDRMAPRIRLKLSVDTEANLALVRSVMGRSAGVNYADTFAAVASLGETT